MEVKFLLFLFIFIAVKGYAGWYEVYNFTGKIDKFPVTFSLQVKPGYFGEPAKKDYNVIGIYKYDKFNNPIRLEGQFDQKTNRIEVYELDKNDKISATFSLILKSNKLSGTWKNNEKQFNVILELKDKLSDLSNEQFQNIQILQNQSLKDYYFVGVYKKNNQSDAFMHELKIINKKTNQIFQTLNFDAIETPTGNLMTIIYDNVTTDKNNDLIVSNSYGRVGGYLSVTYNSAKKRFILNPEPVAEDSDRD